MLENRACVADLYQARTLPHRGRRSPGATVRSPKHATEPASVRAIAARLARPVHDTMQFSAKRSVTLAFGLTILLLGSLGMLSQGSIGRLLDHSAQVEHTERVIAAVGELLALAVDAETGQRGYIITGQEAFLEPFDRAVRLRDARVDAIRSLIRDNPRQQRSLALIEQLTQERFAHLESTIALRRASRGAEAVALVSTGHGKRLMDRTRAVLSEMVREETRLLALRSQAAKASARRTLALVGLLTACGVLVLVASVHRILRELAERRRAEAALRREKEFSASLIEHNLDGILAFDRDLRYTAWNPAMERIAGTPAREVIGRSALEAFPVLVETGEADFFHKALDGVTSVVGSRPYQVSGSGKQGLFEARYVPLRDAAGEILGGLAMIRDTTDSRAAEEALERSEAKFRSLTESAQDMVTVFDAAGAIRYESPAVHGALGYRPEELVGRSVFELIHPDDRGAAMEMFRRSLAHPGERVSYQLRFRHRDGSYRWLEGTGRNLLDDAAVGGVVANSRDVTERVVALEALRAAHELLSAVIESSPLSIITLDADGLVAQWNPAAERTFGWTAAEVLGEPLPFVPEEERQMHRELKARALRGESFTGVEARRRRRDGSEVHISISAAPLWGGDGQLRGVISLNEDISERVRAEERLEAYARELERSNRELQDFAYVASHDLQEPLRKIQAFGDRLRARFAPALGEQGDDYLRRMQGAAGRMQTLIQDLLAFSRVSTRSDPFEAVDLRCTLRDVAADLEGRINSTGGEIRFGDLPVIDADPTQMRQLFQNLIGNALKYHRPDVAPVVEVRARIIAPPGRSGGARVELEVIDNGIGFEPEYSERIFAPFQRLHGRDEYEGTGMGLAICRRIVERHGGSLSAQSQPGAGSTFVVTLPCKQRSQERAA